MQGAHGEMVGLLPPVGLPSKKLPEPTPMYHDEEGGTKERHRPCHGGKGSHPIQALID